MDGNGQPALPAEKKIGQFKARWCRNRFLQLGIARQIGTDNEIIAQGNLTAGLMHMANLHGQLAGDQQIIGIEKLHIIPPGGIKPRITGRGKPTIGLPYDPDSGVNLPDILDTAQCQWCATSIIHDDDVQRTIVSSQD